MSVFKIQQNGINTENANKQQLEASEENTTQSAEVNTSEESKASARETNIEGAIAAPGAEAGGEKQDIMVKIDGPVSRVFTDALNKMLVNESYMTMVPVDHKPSSTQQEQDQDILQVYVWKADELNTEDVVQITNDISRHVERDYVIAIESARSVSKSVGLIEELGKLKNVTVCYSQERALSLVKSKVSR